MDAKIFITQMYLFFELNVSENVIYSISKKNAFKSQFNGLVINSFFYNSRLQIRLE